MTYGPSMVTGQISDRGRLRENNEDALGDIACADGSHLFCVADGMGGFEAGEVASEVAVRVVLQTWCGGAQAPAERLWRVVSAANEAVIAEAQSLGHFGNMGTTIVALALAENQATIAHVGDSRAYLFRSGTLRQLTTDHTEAQSLVEEGTLAQDAVRDHELSHALTRCLGLEAGVEADIVETFELEPDDTFLLCSDGLIDVLEDDAIAQVLRYEAPEAAGQVLVDLTNYYGGPDNITLQIVRFGDRVGSLEVRPDGFRYDHEGARFRIVFAAVALLLLLALLFVFSRWLVTS